MRAKISPCLWFDGQAEAAAEFYTSIFHDSAITQVARYSDAGTEIHGHQAGAVMVVGFELNGQSFTALNGGPEFKFNEAISFQIDCEDQAEIDYYTEKLSAVPEAEQCGWVKDKFGVSWQIVPRDLSRWFSDHTSAATERAMAAMLQMKKLDIAALEKAFQGD